MIPTVVTLRDLADRWRKRAHDARAQALTYTAKGAAARIRFNEAAYTFDTCARQLDQLVRDLELERAE